MSSVNTAAQLAADEAEIEKFRARFGDTEAAKFAADLYKIRRAPPTAYDAFSRLPRVVIVGIALWVGLLETADKLPRLLLTIPQYEATAAEFKAKLMQPELTQAQLDRAKFEAKAAAFQPDLSSVQLDKMKLETKAAAYQPDTAKAQLDKTVLEAKAAKWQPLATAAQGLETEGRFMSNGNLTSSYTERMSSILGRLKPLFD